MDRISNDASLRRKVASRRPLRWLAGLLALPFLIVALYVLADQILRRIPVNADFASAPAGVPVIVFDNGIHVDFLLPIDAAGHDWRRVFDPAATRAGAEFGVLATHVVIGWGHRDFYLNTPDWDDLTAAAVAKSIIGLGGTVMHVTFAEAPALDAAGSVTLTLTDDQYRRLTGAIAATTRIGAGGRAVPIPAAGYGTFDAFYEAKGRYNALHTCNNWAARVLAEAGVRVPWWSPFSGGVMQQLRATSPP